MIQCELHCIHRESHSQSVTIRSHTHEYDELTYFINGRGMTHILEEALPYEGGMFAFYKAGTVHDEINNLPCDLYWLHLSCHMEGLELQEGVFEDPQGELLATLQSLRKASLEQRRHSHLLTESTLAQVVVIAAQLQELTENSAKGPDWASILNFIDENAYGPVDFYALAQSNNYSYHRFRHLFKERFGVSPHAYLTTQRIEYAKRLLKNTPYSLTRIAYDCGFQSSSQFCNIFKKHTGTTPGEYKKQT